jgi:cell division protein FtsQ
MKKQTIIAIALFLLLTTITSQEKLEISKFNIQKIIIENNFLVKEKEIKKLLTPIYDKNIFFVGNSTIANVLMQNDFIESYNIKKKYPHTLKIKIFEKKPIAILIDKKNKFYLSDKVDLITFKKIKEYQNLPYVFGKKKNFEILYNDLKKNNFPFNIIKKYTFFETNRWDVETTDDNLIKLSSKDYVKNLNNYLDLIKKNNFKKYKTFDYRIDNQLILK